MAFGLRRRFLHLKKASHVPVADPVHSGGVIPGEDGPHPGDTNSRPSHPTGLRTASLLMCLLLKTVVSA